MERARPNRQAAATGRKERLVHHELLPVPREDRDSSDRALIGHPKQRPHAKKEHDRDQKNAVRFDRHDIEAIDLFDRDESRPRPSVQRHAR
jgi:hypothetical protein